MKKKIVLFFIAILSGVFLLTSCDMNSGVAKSIIEQLPTQPTETLPTETKPIETKPTETKPTETKPTETKPTETKPTETKPTETKPTETKPTETKPTETKPTETKPTETKQEVAKPQNLAYEDGKLTWDNVTGATSYIVYIDSESYSVNETEYQIEADVLADLDGQTVSISVVAVGNNCTSEATVINVLIGDNGGEVSLSTFIESYEVIIGAGFDKEKLVSDAKKYEINENELISVLTLINDYYSTRQLSRKNANSGNQANNYFDYLLSNYKGSLRTVAFFEYENLIYQFMEDDLPFAVDGQTYVFVETNGETTIELLNTSITLYKYFTTEAVEKCMVFFESAMPASLNASEVKSFLDSIYLPVINELPDENELESINSYICGLAKAITSEMKISAEEEDIKELADLVCTDYNAILGLIKNVYNSLDISRIEKFTSFYTEVGKQLVANNISAKDQDSATKAYTALYLSLQASDFVIDLLADDTNAEFVNTLINFDNLFDNDLYKQLMLITNVPNYMITYISNIGNIEIDLKNVSEWIGSLKEENSIFESDETLGEFYNGVCKIITIINVDLFGGEGPNPEAINKLLDDDNYDTLFDLLRTLNCLVQAIPDNVLTSTIKTILPSIKEYVEIAKNKAEESFNEYIKDLEDRRDTLQASIKELGSELQNIDPEKPYEYYTEYYGKDNVPFSFDDYFKAANLIKEYNYTLEVLNSSSFSQNQFNMVEMVIGFVEEYVYNEFTLSIETGSSSYNFENIVPGTTITSSVEGSFIIGSSKEPVKSFIMPRCNLSVVFIPTNSDAVIIEDSFNFADGEEVEPISNELVEIIKLLFNNIVTEDAKEAVKDLVDFSLGMFLNYNQPISMQEDTEPADMTEMLNDILPRLCSDLVGLGVIEPIEKVIAIAKEEVGLLSIIPDVESIVDLAEGLVKSVKIVATIIRDEEMTTEQTNSLAMLNQSVQMIIEMLNKEPEPEISHFELEIDSENADLNKLVLVTVTYKDTTIYEKEIPFGSEYTGFSYSNLEQNLSLFTESGIHISSHYFVTNETLELRTSEGEVSDFYYYALENQENTEKVVISVYFEDLLIDHIYFTSGSMIEYCSYTIYKDDDGISYDLVKDIDGNILDSKYEYCSDMDIYLYSNEEIVNDTFKLDFQAKEESKIYYVVTLFFNNEKVYSNEYVADSVLCGFCAEIDYVQYTELKDANGNLIVYGNYVLTDNTDLYIVEIQKPDPNEPENKGSLNFSYFGPKEETQVNIIVNIYFQNSLVDSIKMLENSVFDFASYSIDNEYYTELIDKDSNLIEEGYIFSSDIDLYFYEG